MKRLATYLALIPWDAPNFSVFEHERQLMTLDKDRPINVTQRRFRVYATKPRQTKLGDVPMGFVKPPGPPLVGWVRCRKPCRDAWRGVRLFVVGTGRFRSDVFDEQGGGLAAFAWG